MLRCIRTNGNCPGKLNFLQHWVLITISGLLHSFMSFFVPFYFCLLFSGFLQDLRPYMSVNDDRFQVSSSKPKDIKSMAEFLPGYGTKRKENFLVINFVSFLKYHRLHKDNLLLDLVTLLMLELLKPR